MNELTNKLSEISLNANGTSASASASTADDYNEEIMKQLDMCSVSRPSNIIIISRIEWL